MPSAASAAPARPHAALADPLPCQRGGGELWFSDLPAELEQAKACCRQCPLRAACLAGAVERAEPVTAETVLDALAAAGGSPSEALEKEESDL